MPGEFVSDASAGVRENVAVPRLGSGIPLQARTDEMRRLRSAFERAERGVPTTVLLAGDAGVGKSRLIQELGRHAEAHDGIVLTGHCLQAGDVTLPYLPFVEAFGELGAEHRTLLDARPSLAGLLGLDQRSPDAIGVAGKAQQQVPSEPERYLPLPSRPRPAGDDGQLRLFDAVLGLLTDLEARRCVVLVLEDLHWADESSRHLLRFLLTRLRAQRLLVVASYRSDDLHRRHPLRPMLAELARAESVQRIEVGPLDLADTKALVTALAEEPLADSAVARVARRSEGNPFFVEELLASCLDCAEDDPRRNGGVEGELPPALADVLLARVEARSEHARQVLRIASVGGRSVRHSRLQAVVAESVTASELDEALREAVRHHLLLVDGEVYSFRHALLREAIYDDLLPGERVRIHARYADRIAAESGDGVAAALAHHSRASNALPRAFAASVDAGREAARFGAPAEALRFVEEALELLGAVDPSLLSDDADELDLLRRASVLAQRAGQPERSAAYGRTMVAVADARGGDEESARARWRLARALFALEDPSGEALGVIERAWEIVSDRPSGPTRVWVMVVLANRLRREDAARAEAMAGTAVEEARELGMGGPEAEALTTLALIRDADGDAESASRYATEAVEGARRVDAWNAELRARHFLGMRHYELGRLRDAVDVTEEALARAEATGMTWSTYGLELRILRIIARFACGDWEGAEVAAGRPEDTVSDTVRLRVSSAHLHLLVAQGRFDEAGSVHERLRPEWQRDTQLALFAGCCGIELAAWSGQPEVACRRADELIRWMDEYGRFLPLAMIRICALALHAHAEALGSAAERDPGEADRLLARVEWVADSGTGRTGEPGPEALAWLAMARAEHGRVLGTPDPAAWCAAIEAFGYGDVYRQAVARLRHAEALLATGVRSRAAEVLGDVLPVARSIGAVPLAQAATGLARRARLAVDGAPDPVRDVLTARELAVLELVAAGGTNRDIGAKLYISEKTVSVHLSRLMSKLGVTRRAEAVAAAFERGLL